MWIRKVQIIATSAQDSSKQVIIDRHSIEVEVRSVIGWGADTATINIYNLSVEETKTLQNKNFGELFIEVRAGYSDAVDSANFNVRTTPADDNSEARVRVDEGQGFLPTLFSGVITNCVGYKRVPEHVTSLFCISKAAVRATQFIQMKSIPAGTTLRDAIRSMCNEYGFHTISTFGIKESDFDVVLQAGRVFHDTFLNEFNDLLNEYNMSCHISTSEVEIFPDEYGDNDAVAAMAENRALLQLDANSVIGTPVAGIGTFNVNTFLRSDIQPGMVLDITPLLGSELLVNGVVAVSGQNQILNMDSSAFRYGMSDKYLIKEVIHYATTHGQAFQTSISAVLGGNTAMGLNEASWESWYARSGMSQMGGGF